MFDDGFLQLHEGRDPAPSRPGHPLVDGLGGFGVGRFEDHEQSFLEVVGRNPPIVAMNSALQKRWRHTMRRHLSVEHHHAAKSATVFPESCYQIDGLALPRSATRQLLSAYEILSI